MGSTIFCLYQSVKIYDRAFENVEALNNHSSTIDMDWDCRGYYSPGTVIQNSTDFCLEWKLDAWNDEVR